MAQKRTITLNGRVYDAVTGLPIKDATSPSSQKTVARPKPTQKAKPSAPKSGAAVSRGQATASAVHSSVQRSVTLARRAAKKPITSAHKIVRRAQPGRHMDIAGKPARPNLKQFSPHPVVKKVEKADAPAQSHPAAQRAIAKASAKKIARTKVAQPKTTKEVKEQAISRALATPKPQAPRKKKRFTKKMKKRLLITVGIVVIVIASLYGVYRFIPAVSVGIAAAQAGVSASYPDYVPDGFTLSQPVTYSEGEVKLTFTSNSNETSYSLSQKRSSWDSSAVLDNVVEPLAGDNYTTTQERGLRIYTYANGAAWVNGGILYTVDGDASLSNEQVRRIATGL